MAYLELKGQIGRRLDIQVDIHSALHDLGMVAEVKRSVPFQTRIHILTAECRAPRIFPKEVTAVGNKDDQMREPLATPVMKSRSAQERQSSITIDESSAGSFLQRVADRGVRMKIANTD